jgi:hypothetical protein
MIKVSYFWILKIHFLFKGGKMVDALSSLEKKVMDLLDSSRRLKSENIELAAKNQSLHEKIEALEMSMLKEKDDLDQEKEITKMVVDGLLKSIDSLVESENS